MNNARKVGFVWSILMCISLMAGLASAAQEIDKSGLPVVSQAVTLEDTVNIALKNSPIAASARAAVFAAGARVGMARAMTRPQASAAEFATMSDMSMIVSGPESVRPQSSVLTPDRPRIDANLMAMYPIYTGGRLKNQVSSAAAQRDASSADAAAAELDVALSVKTAYYGTLLARRFVDAYRKRADEAGERVRIAEESFKEGRIPKYDLLRNQTDLAEAEQQLNNSQKDAEIALIELKSAMGISQTSELALTDELALKETPGNLDELQARALAGRPEVIAARAWVRSAEAALGVARSAYKPQVYATAMLEGSVTADDGTESGYLVGISAALPILDGGLRKSSVDEARAMLEQMRADERQAVLLVARDVAAGLAALGAASKNASLSQAAVAQAEEDYRVIRLRYEAGKATNVEVLDALASLTRAETNYAEAIYLHNVARETLARAIGAR